MVFHNGVSFESLELIFVFEENTEYWTRTVRFRDIVKDA